MRNAYSAGWTSTEITTHRPPTTGLGGPVKVPGCSCLPAFDRRPSAACRVHPRGLSAAPGGCPPGSTFTPIGPGMFRCRPTTPIEQQENAFYNRQRRAAWLGIHRYYRDSGEMPPASTQAAFRALGLSAIAPPASVYRQAERACQGGGPMPRCARGMYPVRRPCTPRSRCDCWYCVPGVHPGFEGLSAVDAVPGLRITIRATRTVGNTAARDVGTVVQALFNAFKLESVSDPVYTMDDKVQVQAIEDKAASQPGEPFWDLTVVAGPFRGTILGSAAGGMPQGPTNALLEEWVYIVRPKQEGGTLDVGALREALRKMAPAGSHAAVELVSVPPPPKRFAQAGTVAVLAGLFGLAVFTARR